MEAICPDTKRERQVKQVKIRSSRSPLIPLGTIVFVNCLDSGTYNNLGQKDTSL